MAWRGGRADDDVLGTGALDICDVDAHRGVKLCLGRDLDDGGLLESVPGHDRGAVAGSQDGAQALVITRDGLDGNRRGRVHRDGGIARVVVGGFKQALDATHRGEAPVFLTSVGHGDVVQVERGRAVRTRGVRLLGVRPSASGPCSWSRQ